MSIMARPFAVLCLQLAVATAADAPKVLRPLQSYLGPKTADLAGKATLKIDATLAFLDEASSMEFLDLTGGVAPAPAAKTDPSTAGAEFLAASWPYLVLATTVLMSLWGRRLRKRP